MRYWPLPSVTALRTSTAYKAEAAPLPFVKSEVAQASLFKPEPGVAPPAFNEGELHPIPSPPPSRDIRELRAEAQMKGYTGDQCTTCNSLRMKVSGHCLVCEDCGTTTGCS